MVGVRVEHTPGRVAVAVSLTSGSAVVSAQVERAAAESQGLQVAAEATLEAVRQTAPPGTQWVLQHAASTPMAAGTAVVAHVLLETERGQEHLIGSALSTSGRLEEAAAQAVVDAVDRRLSWYLRT